MLGVLSKLASRYECRGCKATEPPQTVTLRSFSPRSPVPPRSGLPAPRALVIDQFEELFTLSPKYWRQRAELFDQIARALEQDPLLRVVLAIREDFLAQLDPYAELLPGGLRAASGWSASALRRRSARSEPVRDTYRSFVAGVGGKARLRTCPFRVDTAAGRMPRTRASTSSRCSFRSSVRTCGPSCPPRSTRSPRSTCTRPGTWTRSSGASTTGSRGRGPWAHVREYRLRRWIDGAFITSGGTRSTVYRTDTATAEIPNAAIDELESRHLIRAEWRAGARWYELTHDRFIQPIQSSNARFHSDRQRVRRRRAAAGVVALAPVLALLAFWGAISNADDSSAPAGSIVAFPVEVDVKGEGDVVSSPLGIACPTACSATFENGASLTVAARANPRKGSRFVRWSGACQDTSKECRVTVVEETSISAVFTRVLGKSAAGRAIEVIQTGNSRAKHRILVIGCAAGDECTGIPIANALSSSRPPTNVGLWIIPNLNPDGFARGERKNANGVDLNRNFPVGWKSASGDSRSENYRGKQPFSEPESRITKRLVEDVKPSITIWYFARKKPCRAEGVADAGGSAAIPRAYSRAVGLDDELIAGTNPGSAPTWQNETFPDTTAFFVELPCGTLRREVVERHARAVLRLPAGS